MVKTNVAAATIPLRHYTAEIMLLMVAAVWGASYGLAKIAVSFYPVLGFLALRFCITSLLIWPYLLRRTWTDIIQTTITGVPLGLILLAIFISETYGLSLTQASNAAFLISLCVVFTPLIEWLILRVRPGPRSWAAVGISISGAWLLTAGSTLSFGLGDALIVLAALLRGVMVSCTNLLTRGKKLDAMALTAVQTTVVGVGCLCLAWLTLPQGLPDLPVDKTFWLCTGFLILFCTLFAFFSQNYALQHIAPTRVALLMGSEPVFGALFAVIFLRENLSVTAWIGGGLIVMASMWAVYRRE